MNSHYETLYGIGLLDDLHNYFPAILYNPRSFRSVADLLGYVQQQTRAQFDLFSLGQRDYRNRVGSALPVAPFVPSPVPSPVALAPLAPSPGLVPLQTTSVDLSENTVSNNSTLQPSLQRTLGSPSLRNTFQYTFTFPEQEEQEEQEETRLTTQLLAALLQLPLRRQSATDSFLQPIPIVPTQQQIQANSTLGNLVSDTEHTCAICQDVLEATQEGRKLNACGHWFHKNCIDTWFSGNVHCPVCRHDIREPLATP